jgi:hypothetical protein
VYRDCNCTRNGITNDAAFQSCLRRHNIGAGYLPGENCQSDSRHALRDCCGKSDWTPNWIAYPDPVDPPPSCGYPGLVL